MSNIILTVDDFQDSLALLSDLLRKQFPDAEVLTADGGVKGLELAQSRHPDLVLLDARMPDMDGFEVCRRLKEDPATATIQVLMVSGVMGESENRTFGIESGADGYIAKPFEPAELIAQANALLRIKNNEDALRGYQRRLETYLAERTRTLRASEEQLRTLFEKSPDAIFVQDQHGNVLDVNPAACALHAMDREELVGKNVVDLVPPEHRGAVETSYEKWNTGALTLCEGYSYTRDGRSIPVEVRASRIEYNEQPANLLHVRDLTERKKAEEREQELHSRLARAKRMESLGLLAGGVAHDLNNILGPLVAYPELMLMELPDDSPLQNDIREIDRSAKRAAEVIQDLLTLARRGSYQIEPLELNDFIRSECTSAGFQKLASDAPRVEVKVRLAPEPLVVSGSLSHLSRAFMNMAHNAFEAMRGNGVLEIRTSVSTLSDALSGYDTIDEGVYAVVSVKDTGEGINNKDLEHIFEPFYTKRKMGREGSGLGLSVVYGVMQDLNGHIDVKTEPGRGAEFRLFFPLTSSPPRTRALSPACCTGTETVLVIDDVKEQRELAVRLLSGLGYQVTAVQSGHAAVDHLTKNTVDLVILDMIMEDGFDGLDTYNAILKVHPGQRCIIASGFAETDRVKKAQAIGVGEYIRKPYTRDGIAAAVRRELDSASHTAGDAVATERG